LARHIGIIAALPDELRPVARRLGLRLRLLPLSDGLRAAGRPCGRHRVFALLGGVGPAAAERAARRALAEGCDLLLSIGFAGALDPGLGPGAVVRLSAVTDGAGGCWPADGSKDGVLGLTRPAAITDVAAKAELRAATGAAVVDMETAGVARAAAAAAVPWRGLRAVSDTAAEALPPFVARCIRPDLGRVLAFDIAVRGLIDPRLWWPLLRLALRSVRAGRALAAAVAATLEDLP
jgi:adenosylhomocysteine nucleosidase